MRIQLILTLTGMACYLAAAVFAQAGAQSPPPGGEPKNFKLPERYDFSLDNGLRATLVQYGELPKTTVRLVVRVGNINEAEDQVWLADLTGEMLKEGTGTRTAEQIAEQAAGMGGGVSVGVGMDQSGISGDVLSEFAPELVALIADIARNPLLPESEVPRLRNDMLRRLSIQKSRPQPQALEKFRALLYPDHPYGRVFPEPKLLESYTADDVRSFYEDNFGARRCHIYICGKFDPGEVEQAVRTAFGGWRAGPEPLIDPPEPESPHGVFMVDRPGAAQSTIYLGLPVISPAREDYLALRVTNAILGGMFSSRITSNIREDKGYTYSPRSSISTRYRDAYWVETADVGTDVTGAALREILYEIDRLQNEPPPGDELEGVQNYTAGTFVLQNSSRSGIIGQLAFVDLHELDMSYLSGYVADVHAITPEEVQRIARTYMREEDMTLVVVGDEAAIKGQFSGFGDLVKK